MASNFARITYDIAKLALDRYPGCVVGRRVRGWSRICVDDRTQAGGFVILIGEPMHQL